MIELDVTIVNRLGLHARAAAKFVKLAGEFKSEIELARGSRKINGKSIMGVMMLAASKGTQLRLIADGEDEQIAVERLAELVAARFGENE